MSISEDEVEQYADQPAVICCGAKAGTIIGVQDLEDPRLFPDLTKYCGLKITEGCITVRQALGRVLKTTVDAMTPVTSDLIGD